MISRERASGDSARDFCGYEGQQGEIKPESSETVNCVNWQARGGGGGGLEGWKAEGEPSQEGGAETLGALRAMRHSNLIRASVSLVYKTLCKHF